MIQGVLECYRSLWSTRAISYRYDAGIPHESVNMAVIVQTMVDARGAGVMFTKNPVIPTEDQIVIESNFGLGESVVAGYAIPDRYTITKTSLNGVTQFKVVPSPLW